jgi:hypothetical protein
MHKTRSSNFRFHGVLWRALRTYQNGYRASHSLCFLLQRQWGASAIQICARHEETSVKEAKVTASRLKFVRKYINIFKKFLDFKIIWYIRFNYEYSTKKIFHLC